MDLYTSLNTYLVEGLGVRLHVWVRGGEVVLVGVGGLVGPRHRPLVVVVRTHVTVPKTRI